MTGSPFPQARAPQARAPQARAPQIRLARRDDLERIAALHAERISEGFLSSLGPRFLECLYRRVLASRGSFVAVAIVDGDVVGFAAGTERLGALYKSFLLRDAPRALVVAGARLARSSRRVVETLRYGSRGHAGTEELPVAEILAVAVDASCAGRGIGRALVDHALEEFARRDIAAVKVVAGVDNSAAESLYRGAGFADAVDLAVHDGVASRAYIWRRSSPSPAVPTAAKAVVTEGIAPGAGVRGASA